ncbi:ornithine cyclodeaminase family protein, partial [Enterococcus faecalis]
VLPDGENQNLFALMPAYLGKNRFFGAKIITAFPENPQKNLASHLGQILLFDSSTGRPVAMMDANAITWLRTAAVSALATDYLAAPKAKSI